VFIRNGGSFTMKNGVIKDNDWDGVVADEDADITISGGTISGNRTGVQVTGNNNTLTMEGGTISGNSQVGVWASGVNFTMSGGEISGNRWGVWVTDGNFTMSGGEISGSEQDGVTVVAGSFTMSEGEISSNGKKEVEIRASDFTMLGGTISSSDADADTAIYVWDGAGASVPVVSSLTLGGSPTITGTIAALPEVISVITTGEDEFEDEGQIYTLRVLGTPT
jgi:hypothetical protein